MLAEQRHFCSLKDNCLKKGFNPTYAECFEEVELNLACLTHHRKNYFVGDAVCYHFESQTRQHQGRIQISDYEKVIAFLQKQANVLSEYVINF